MMTITLQFHTGETDHEVWIRTFHTDETKTGRHWTASASQYGLIYYDAAADTPLEAMTQLATEMFKDILDKEDVQTRGK